ncbi:MAG: triose-phosphate isomerase, partial [Deltaproteobacteria bacterium]
MTDRIPQSAGNWKRNLLSGGSVRLVEQIMAGIRDVEGVDVL